MGRTMCSRQERQGKMQKDNDGRLKESKLNEKSNIIVVIFIIICIISRVICLVSISVKVTKVYIT